MLYLYEISHFLAFLCPALTFYIFCLPDQVPSIVTRKNGKSKTTIFSSYDGKKRERIKIKDFFILC